MARSSGASGRMVLAPVGVLVIRIAALVFAVVVASTVMAPISASQAPQGRSHSIRRVAVPLADAACHSRNSARKPLSLARDVRSLAREAFTPCAQPVLVCAQAFEPCAQAAERRAQHPKRRVQAVAPYVQSKKPCVQSKKPCVQSKKPCVQSKKPCVQSKKPCAPSWELCAQGPMACGWRVAGGTPGGAARRCITARWWRVRRVGCGVQTGRTCPGAGLRGPSLGRPRAAKRSLPARRS